MVTKCREIVGNVPSPAFTSVGKHIVSGQTLLAEVKNAGMHNVRIQYVVSPGSEPIHWYTYM